MNKQLKSIQNTLSIVEDQTISTVMITLIVGFIICIIALTIIMRYQYNAVKQNKKPNRLSYIAIVPIFTTSIFIMTGLLSAWQLTTYITKFGFDQYSTMPIKKIYPELKTLPIESKLKSELPDNLKKCTIIYYRFGCPDCKAVHKDLYDQLKVYDNVYYIYTRSKTGKKLRKTYPVKNVPTGIYIDDDNKTYSCFLYNKKENGLDWQNLNELIKFINKGAA